METIEELRARLRSMSDEELRGYGVVAKIMCTSSLNRDRPPRECFQRQLFEAREEWKRRHPDDDVMADVSEQICAECGKPVTPENVVSMPTITGQVVIVHNGCVSDFVNRQAKGAGS